MMEFEWDKAKAAANLAKHGIDFDDAKLVFLDPLRFEEVDERHSDQEIRFKVLGEVEGRVLSVVFTWREGRRRLISARRANRGEREKYGSSEA